eukprot:TRINITY_DN1583_c0_g1_i1.p2 TRINITY_DN1583_c0_g1~~TRINITY_DN1583_c0_g1_i1.p2  ORF type:complete len:223 (+),score=59.93 TRINITY_DN1583_c0_g1_i1:124-792(+)
MEGIDHNTSNDDCALLATRDYQERLFHFNNPTEIVPGLLWLGGMRNAGSHIQDLEIQHVLNMAAVPDQNAGCGVDPYESASLGPTVRYKGIECYDVPSYPIDRHFEETYTFIRQAIEKKQRVYVHCVAGISRSVSIVVAYLMRTNFWTLETALQFVRCRRTSVCPNDGFMRVLRAYEQQLMDDGILRRPPSRPVRQYVCRGFDDHGAYATGGGAYDSISCYD